MTPSTPVRRVGYVVSLFPSYDETFILREMKALTEQRLSLRIFSLRRREQDVVQEDARAFIPGTHYVPYLLSADVLAALTRASLRQTWAVARVVALIVRGCWRRPMAVLKSLAFVPKAICFAEIAREQGIERLHAHWATYPATTTLLMFLAKYTADTGRRITRVEPDALKLLMQHDWPGNVRELEIVIHRSLLVASRPELTPDDLPRELTAVRTGGAAADDGAGGLRSLEELERLAIESAIAHFGGNLSDVARQLGIGRSTRYRKLEQYGLRPTKDEG